MCKTACVQKILQAQSSKNGQAPQSFCKQEEQEPAESMLPSNR